MQGIIPDTLSGALILSVFDYVASFFVLAFFGLVISLLRKLD
ncbi:MAG TPA: hypothetical protein VMW83_05765 [Spirochaetia bacterium]|nr:hypothetical protein [Spirochaetia bacterium]